MTGTRDERVREIVTRYAAHRGPLLPALHAVQEDLGWIDLDDAAVIADVLNLSRADVHGVVTFYADFRDAAAPRHTVSVCRGEACQAVGGQELYERSASRFATVDDVTVTEVFCLGNCALGPSAQLDGRLHGRLSDERVSALTQGWS